MEENIFVVIVCKRLEQQCFKIKMFKDCFNNNCKQTIKMPKKGKYIKFKNSGKNKVTTHDLNDLFVIYIHDLKIMESKIL